MDEHEMNIISEEQRIKFLEVQNKIEWKGNNWVAFGSKYLLSGTGSRLLCSYCQEQFPTIVCLLSGTVPDYYAIIVRIKF